MPVRPIRLFVSLLPVCKRLAPPPPILFSSQPRADEPKERHTKNEQHDHERAGQPQGCVLRAQAVDAPGFGGEMRGMMQSVPLASRAARKLPTQLLRLGFVAICATPQTNHNAFTNNPATYGSTRSTDTPSSSSRQLCASAKARLSEGFTF